MNWRRLLLWIAFLAVVAGGILVIVRVAKMTFGTQRIAAIALLESVA